MKITEHQVEVAYSIARKVYLGEIRIKNGSTFLSEKHGLNINSARDFINTYKHLVNGNVFHRGMSAAAMKYFLDSIYKDEGANFLKQAVKALNLHIDYWENHYDVTAHKLRKVSEHFDALCSLPQTESEYIERFNVEVKNALTLSAAERKKHIRRSEKYPSRVEVKTYIFSRNPYVVAETLKKADGKCEECSKNAPFIRVKDGTPYLEVHHKVRLADGGEDTLENTLALCPNCHRKLHFGYASV